MAYDLKLRKINQTMSSTGFQTVNSKKFQRNTRPTQKFTKTIKVDPKVMRNIIGPKGSNIKNIYTIPFSRPQNMAILSGGNLSDLDFQIL